MRYRAISELVEIGAAYEVAIENFPDDLEPDSVEGRREIISSALNYLDVYKRQVFEDAPEILKSPRANNHLTAHEYSHLVYQPDWKNKVGLSVYNPVSYTHLTAMEA